MYDSKWFRLIVVGLLFTTACSRYMGKSTLMDNADYGIEGLAGDGERTRMLRSSGIPQRELCNLDWSTVDLCRVNDHKTFLCKAIDRNYSQLLRLLLQYIKSNPVKYPHEKVVYLIAGLGDKTEDMSIQMPLLMRAVTRAHPENLHVILDMISLLFETLAGYDLHACAQFFSLRFGSTAYTVLHQAVEVSSLKIVEYLINTFIETKLALTQGLAYPSVLNSLLEILSIGNNQNETPLGLALAMCSLNFSESLAISRYLMQYGDPASKMIFGCKSAIYDLIKRGDSEAFTAILNAIIKRLREMNGCQDQEISEKVVHLKDEYGRTLLHYAVLSEAAKRSKPHAVKYLMQLGASCTSFDKSGLSPLFIATLFDDLRIVQLLLDKKFPGNVRLKDSINDRGKAGLTPLNFAVWPKDRTTILTILRFFRRFVKFNQEINRDNAIGKIDIEIVQALLNAGADPLIADNLGRTPLHRVVEKGILDFVEPLLKAGANPLAKDLKGATPLDIVVEQLPLKPYQQGARLAIMRMLAEMLNHAITLVQTVGVKPCRVDPISLFMHFQSVYKDGTYKGRQELLNQLFFPSMCELVHIPTEIISECKGIKRSLDRPAGYMQPDIKRKRQSIKRCDDSSGPKTQIG